MKVKVIVSAQQLGNYPTEVAQILDPYSEWVQDERLGETYELTLSWDTPDEVVDDINRKMALLSTFVALATQQYNVETAAILHL